MLKRVSIQNFRCLRDVELNLEPLTILVGPNATGKSAVLDALNPRPETNSSDKWQFDNDLKMMRRFEDESGNYICFQTEAGAHTTREGWDSKSVKYQKLQLDLGGLRQENIAEAAHVLDSTGSNLTNVFSTLTRNQQIALRDEFCRLVPVFGDINVRPVSSGKLRLEFQDRWNESVTYKPAQVSDGTMLVLAYLVLQYQEKPPGIVAIEEPERGLHPYLLERLVNFFRDLATGARGPGPFNIVLATHSPELLNFARPEEVRFLTRKSDTGETVIEEPPVEEEGWEETMQIYLDSLGDAWLSGGLGGVPGR